MVRNTEEIFPSSTSGLSGKEFEKSVQETLKQVDMHLFATNYSIYENDQQYEFDLVYTCSSWTILIECKGTVLLKRDARRQLQRNVAAASSHFDMPVMGITVYNDGTVDNINSCRRSKKLQCVFDCICSVVKQAYSSDI